MGPWHGASLAGRRTIRPRQAAGGGQLLRAQLSRGNLRGTKNVKSRHRTAGAGKWRNGTKTVIATVVYARTGRFTRHKISDFLRVKGQVGYYLYETRGKLSAVRKKSKRKGFSDPATDGKNGVECLNYRGDIMSKNKVSLIQQTFNALDEKARYGHSKHEEIGRAHV